MAKHVALKEEQSTLALANEIKRSKLVTDRLESECHEKTAAFLDEAISMNKATLTASESVIQYDEMSQKLLAESLAKSVLDQAKITTAEEECEKSRKDNGALSRQNAEFLNQKTELQSEALRGKDLIRDLQRQVNTSSEERVEIKKTAHRGGRDAQG